MAPIGLHRRRPHAGRSRSSSGAEAEGLTDAWARRRHRGGPAADARHRRQPERLGHRGDPPLRGAPATRRASARRGQTDGRWTTFDFVIIGAGPAGEAAAHKARELGASVAVVDRRWFGGSCPHIGCLPSKSLLNARRRATPEPGRRTTGRAPRRGATTWSTGPPTPRSPTTAGHVRALEEAGAVVYRGEARIVGRGRVDGHATTAPAHEIAARNVMVAVGSLSKVPPLDGHRRRPRLDQPRGDADPRAAAEPAGPGRRADGLRAGPGLRPVRRADDDRPVRSAARADRSSAQLRGDPRRARARRRRPSGPASGPSRARAGAGTDGAHVIDLDDGSTAEGHAVLLAVGRDVPARRPRARALRPRHDRPDAVPARRPAARRGRACGSSATRPGPSCTPTRPTTRASSRCGWRWARPVEPDYRALPRATYTDPEAAFVGRHARGGARGRASMPSSSSRTSRRGPGYAVEATIGHVTIVVDRGPASSSAPPWPARTPRRRSTNASSRSRPASRSSRWPRRSTPSRRRRGSSTACSPTPGGARRAPTRRSTPRPER